MFENIIYLDNNATTAVDSRVLDSMLPFLTSNYANASSTHKFGKEAYNGIKSARKKVADLIGADSNEIIFTSGATESINMAINGVVEAYKKKGKHIITVLTEHSAVLNTCKYWETKGYEVSYLTVNKNGLIDLEELKSVLRTDTILVSIMYVNNETGVIQPIKGIADIVHDNNSLFMTDATQAVGKIPFNVDDFYIDLLSMSGHKMYAPKGVGALYIRQRNSLVKIPALIHGGGQERGLRSGTLNVPGIVALGTACEIAKKEMRKDNKNISQLRDYLESELLKIPNTHLNGSVEKRLYNTCNICFKGVDSDALIIGLSNLDDYLIVVSKGSACSSSNMKPSHVLIAMGLDDISAFNSIRISLGKFNSKNDIEIVVKNITQIVNDLREML